jgi:hypothetical protein
MMPYEETAVPVLLPKNVQEFSVFRRLHIAEYALWHYDFRRYQFFG